MTETIMNSIEDVLVDSLNFKLSPGASYIIDRSPSCVWSAAGSQTYVSGTGGRLIRVPITSSTGWLDPASVRVVFTIQNNGTGAQVLRPLSSGHNFFRRIRSIFSGATTDDIDYQHRTSEMLSILSSRSHRENLAVENFGRMWNDTSFYPKGGDFTGNSGTFYGINPGGYQTISIKPLCGLLNQPLYLPLCFSSNGLVLEFELVSNGADAVVAPNTLATNSGATFFNNTNTSTSWTISDFHVIGDIITLDSALQNSYAEFVLSGKALNIPYNTYITMLQNTAATNNMSVNVSRAVSRLKTVYFSFDNATLDLATSTNIKDSIVKEFNSFVHPMNGAYSFANEIEYSIQIGSKILPCFAVRSASQAYYELKKSLGIQDSAYHSMSVDSLDKYIRDHFIIGCDCEKILSASWTGLNTKSGDLMVIRAKIANGGTAQIPVKIYITLHCDNILEIRDAGAVVYD